MELLSLLVASGPDDARLENQAARRVMRIAPRATRLAAMTLAGALCATGIAWGQAAIFDCLARSPACPEIEIEGDPWFEIPGFGPSP